MSDTSRVVREIAKIATATVLQQGGIREVTVLSKNPDGSLNVDDGTGGCARQITYRNAKQGERIRLGTEPSFLTKTDSPPRFFDLPPPFNPPQFPPFTPENPDRYMISDRVACWGTQLADQWSNRTTVKTWTKLSGSPNFYGQGYIFPFPNATDNSAQGVGSGAGYNSFPVVDVPGATNLPWGYGRTLYQFPRLDTIVADDEIIESAFVDVTLRTTANTTNPRFTKIDVFEWQGLGFYPDGTLRAPLSISTDDIPGYSSTNIIAATAFLNGGIRDVVLGEALITDNSTTLWSVKNSIPLNVYGIAALQRRRPTVLAFLVDVFRKPNTIPAQNWTWTPWLPELPGLHAPKKAPHVLGSGPGTASTPETRLRLRMKIKQA